MKRRCTRSPGPRRIGGHPRLFRLWVRMMLRLRVAHRTPGGQIDGISVWFRTTRLTRWLCRIIAWDGWRRFEIRRMLCGQTYAVSASLFHESKTETWYADQPVVTLVGIDTDVRK